MAFGFLNLPKVKWWIADLRQVILKKDFKDVENALLEANGLMSPPNFIVVDETPATSVKVQALPESPAAVLMSGFPNILHPGAFIGGVSSSLSDGRYRVNTADAVMDFDVSATVWGTEKSSQLYALFAIAADIDTTFTLKAMPFCTVQSDSSQVIKCGTHETPASDVNYGFVVNEFIDGLIYVLSGNSRGLSRTIVANTVDNATTIEYGGGDLSLAAGVTFIILPSDTNFAYLGCLFNNAAGNIVDTKSNCKSAAFEGAGTYYWIILSPFRTIQVVGRGGGGGGGGAPGGIGGGGYLGIGSVEISPGEIFKIVVGSGGAAGGMMADGTAGGATTIYTALGNKVFPAGSPGLGDGTPGIGLFGVVSNGYGDGGAAGSSILLVYYDATAGVAGCVYLSW